MPNLGDGYKMGVKLGNQEYREKDDFFNVPINK